MVAESHGILLKKKFGQHFLRDQSVVDGIIEAVKLTPETSVFEIGCGDGFLTRRILQEPIKQLWIFEIDEDWVKFITDTIKDNRMQMFHENILDVDFQRFAADAPWTLLANLPYQITFPIFHMLAENRHLLAEGVVMIQEEVAQKIVKKSGRGYGFISLYFQHVFSMKLLQKIKPAAFHPAPKVDSRLLYFKPRTDQVEIPDEANFWKFIKICFRQPRRTLRNNLAQSHYDTASFDDELLGLRAQQLSMDDFVRLWKLIPKKP